MNQTHTSPWQTLSSKTVLKNKWFSVRQDSVIQPNGQPGEYNVVVSPDAVFVVPVDDDLNVYLVGLYRYPTSMYSLELPAGSSDGQDLLLAAKRELQEEAGLAAKDWKLLGSFQSANGLMAEKGHTFLARGLTNTATNEQHEEGIAEVKKVPFAHALRMVQTGEISDCQSVAGLCYAALELGFTKAA